jgi:hypothetical protein
VGEGAISGRAVKPQRERPPAASRGAVTHMALSSPRQHQNMPKATRQTSYTVPHRTCTIAYCGIAWRHDALPRRRLAIHWPKLSFWWKPIHFRPDLARGDLPPSCPLYVNWVAVCGSAVNWGQQCRPQSMHLLFPPCSASLHLCSRCAPIPSFVLFICPLNSRQVLVVVLYFGSVLELYIRWCRALLRHYTAFALQVDLVSVFIFSFTLI